MDTNDDKGSPKQELQEKDFIQNGSNKNFSPMFIMFFVLVCVVALFWGIGSWYYQKMDVFVQKNPFLQVTNRQLSVFLWQFPQYLPQNVKNKSGYLPGFEHQNRIGVLMEAADSIAIAPPELLFLYYTWDRLLKMEFVQRAISKVEFRAFLEDNPEWLPRNWPEAPEAYTTLMRTLTTSGKNNLAEESEEAMPMAVREAFQGWKNFVLEGKLINDIAIKNKEMAQFLNSHPHYGRSYWRNLSSVAPERYLYTITYGEYDPEATVPDAELAPFARVAFFNWKQSISK